MRLILFLNRINYRSSGWLDLHACTTLLTNYSKVQLEIRPHFICNLGLTVCIWVQLLHAWNFSPFNNYVWLNPTNIMFDFRSLIFCSCFITIHFLFNCGVVFLHKLHSNTSYFTVQVLTEYSMADSQISFKYSGEPCKCTIMQIRHLTHCSPL